MMINHIMCTLKILTDVFFAKQKIKTKNIFVRVAYNALVVKMYWQSENVLTELKRDCLSINGVQAVKSEKGTIKFKRFFKQIPFPFKICPDFECNLKSVKAYEGCYPKKVSKTLSLQFCLQSCLYW